jgi:ribosome-associated protein
MIQITPIILIDESEIHEEFVRSSGPGGQNVNKVSTAVQLRFNVNSASLSEEVRDRLTGLAGGRITTDGILVIDARRFRSQAANRQAARERFYELIRRSSLEPQIRHKTRPTLASKMRRLETKRRRSKTKILRRSMPNVND